MEKRKEIFREEFRDYLIEENGNYEVYLKKYHDGNWASYLFHDGIDEVGAVDFAKAFAYYLSEGYPTEQKEILRMLNTQKDKAPFRTFYFCTVIQKLLYTTDDHVLSELAQNAINDLYQETIIHRSSIILFFNDEKQDHLDAEQLDYAEYGWFLKHAIGFASAVYPQFYRDKHENIADPIFCSIAITATFSNKTFRPDLLFIRHALHVDVPYLFLWATQSCFHVFMLNEEYQLAYDILYSWIHMKMVGYFSNISRSFSETEIQWRNANKEYLVTHKAVMAFLCSGMADLQRTASVHQQAFRNKSTSYAYDVLSSKEQDSIIFSYCAPSLLNNRDYEKAAIYSKEKLATFATIDNPDSEFSIETYIVIIRSYLGMLCSNSGEVDIISAHDWKILCSYLEPFITICLPSLQSRYEISESESSSIAYICSYAKHLSSSKRIDIVALLMCVYHLIQQIKRELWEDSYIQTVYDTREDETGDSTNTPINKEKQVAAIAYYTTLDNLKYLLEPVYANSHRDRPKPLKDFEKKDDVPSSCKNCLTMMHAHYMNDPREGIALSDALSEWIDQNSNFKNVLFRNCSPETFRERLFDNQFVFLKSFTDIVDQLNMWSMYGSDRSEGSDSNGCCVCIAPRTFESMLSISHKTSIIRDLDKEHDTDDLRLYKIAYLKNNELVAPENDNLKHYFNLLKEMVRNLNDILAGDPVGVKQDTEIIMQLLQEILTPIVFLFKDASYRAEHELRLIVTRSRTKEDMERISKTPQKPPKLYVNPYHQVYVDQIILGPKVKQPDAWIPHLQYELTKMWETWPVEKYGKRVPSVRKSSINYRD